VARSKFAVIPTRPVPLVVGAFLEFDATTKRDRTSGGQVTEFPKESGLDPLNDDVIFDSERLTVTAHFTDFPLYYGPAQVGFPGRAKIYSDSVRLIRERKVPCIVLSGDDILLSMVITSLGEPRTADTGDAVDMEIEFVHVEIGELGLAQALVDAASQALGAEEPVIIGLKP
jgi:hypothetical protein